MRIRAKTAIAILAAGFFFFSAQMGTWAIGVSMLTPSEAASLSDPARANYAAGADLYDHTHGQLALEAFQKAAVAAPEHIPIRLLIARLAQDLAKSRMGTEAESLYSAALNALREVDAMPASGDAAQADAKKRAASLGAGIEAKAKDLPRKDEAITRAARELRESLAAEQAETSRQPDSLDRVIAQRKAQEEMQRYSYYPRGAYYVNYPYNRYIYDPLYNDRFESYYPYGRTGRYGGGDYLYDQYYDNYGYEYYYRRDRYNPNGYPFYTHRYEDQRNEPQRAINVLRYYPPNGGRVYLETDDRRRSRVIAR